MRVVKIGTIALASLFSFAAPVLAQNDLLVMRNGDRLTGEIKGLDAGTLHVSLDYVDGTISVQWSQVARIESSRLFIVKTSGGYVYTGLLSTNETSRDQPVKVQIAVTPEKKVVLETSQIVTIEETAATFRQRLNGDISAGVTYSKGNNSTQFNLSSSLEYPHDRWLAQANFNSTLSSNSGVTASTRNHVGFNSIRLLQRENYFYSAGGSFLQSSEQGISRQTTLGGGFGRYLKNTNRARIAVLGGLLWQRTNYEGSGPLQGTQDIAAALIRADARLFEFKKTHLNASADLVPAISEPGRIFFRTNSNFYIKLFGNLSWNVSFFGSWDSRPPSGLSGSDYGSSSGLSWSFGNK